MSKSWAKAKEEGRIAKQKYIIGIYRGKEVSVDSRRLAPSSKYKRDINNDILVCIVGKCNCGCDHILGQASFDYEYAGVKMIGKESIHFSADACILPKPSDYTFNINKINELVQKMPAAIKKQKAELLIECDQLIAKIENYTSSKEILNILGSVSKVFNGQIKK